MSISDLPALNACLNGLSAYFLLFGYYLIRRGRKVAHRNCMIVALTSSTLFLISYVTYHVMMQRLHGKAHTSFVDPAWFRPIYLSLLVSHLILAIAIVPLVIMT